MMDDNLNDIANWSNDPKIFMEKFLGDKEKRDKVYSHDLRELKIDHINTYCLLKAKVSNSPRGFYTMLIKGFPIDNLFWWDFIIESERGFVQIYRTQSKIELMTNIKDFDAKTFFDHNLNKYKQEIKQIKEELEEHTIFINHFDSYYQCVNELWKEIKKLEIDPIEIEEKLEKDESEFKDHLEKFISDNIKFHSFAKSLLLNSAFLIESYINMIIRLSAKEELKEYPNILKKHLQSNFSEKLKNLKYYSKIFKKDINLQDQEVIDVLKVMTHRNKYVHSDLSSKLNEIGTVYFDHLFPVFPNYEYSPIIQNIVRTYQIPSFEIIEFSYKSANVFIQYIKNHFIDNADSEYVKRMLGDNPIGFNHVSKNYSSIFSRQLMDFRVK
jgi:hypothetical protein